jgi:transcriptional regulator GlxA family with amidase domain
LIAFIRRQATAFLLHAAGLLSGRRATTHWASSGRLRALGNMTGKVQLEAESFSSATIYGTAASSHKGAAYFRML